MMTEVFFAKIRSYADLSAEAERAWAKLLRHKQYRKDDTFIKAGDVPTSYAFVVNGLFFQHYVGPSGDLIYFVKMDDCQYASISIAQHKARASAKYRRPTVVFERLLGRGPFFSYLATLDDVIASRGGNPIVVDGKIIGAIGVSGGTGSQDDLISQAGAASMK